LDFPVFFSYFYNAKLKLVKLTHIKYYFLTLLLFGASLFLSGQSSSNATVTIIGGDSPGTENAGTDPSANPAPPANGGELADPQTIEPTLENGFHIRYRIEETPRKEEEEVINEYASLSTADLASTGGSSTGAKIKRKHVMSMTERRFNFNKRLKAMMPQRKKKYRPNVCGRF